MVVGSGPNGLAAAITIAREKKAVLLLEAGETVGGGMRTRELTLPGFRHDVCSAIHPLALASPFFRSLDLAPYGIEWIHPPIPLAHPLDKDNAVLLERSIDDTARGLGRDGVPYQQLFAPMARNWDGLVEDLLKPLGPPAHSFQLMRFALLGLRSAQSVVQSRFKDARARALFAGNACHSILPLGRVSSAAFGLMMTMLGHAVGWPMARGGSQAIADALASYFLSQGGEIALASRITSMDDLPKAAVTIFDVSPRDLALIAGDRLPDNYLKRLETHCHGPGVFKVDWALDGPVPWKDPTCLKAGTLHLGGTFEEIAAGEEKVWRGVPPEKPFVLLSQPSLFDPTRAPSGMHTAWAYCHVPNGCTKDMTTVIEDQVERFAPGFRHRIKARHAMSPARMEEYNANYIGGDIVGGVQDFRKLFLRPFGRWRAYSTPARGLYLCSSSMPPGGGVHGMCGHLASRKALREIFGFTSNSNLRS